MKHTTCNNIQSNQCNSFSLRYYFSGRQCAFFWFVLPLRKFIFDESIWAMRCTYICVRMHVCMLIIVSRIMSTFILEAAAHSQEVSIIYSVCPSLKTSFLLLVTRQMLKSKLPPPHCWPSGEPEKCLKFMYTHILIRFVIRIKF